MSVLLAWTVSAAVTWAAMLTFTPFVLWDDDGVAIIIGLIVSATLCAFFWPFVLLAAIGTLLHALLGGD